MLSYLNSRIMDLQETLRAEAKANHLEVIAKLTALDAFLREGVMSKLDEMDRRLTTLGGKRD